MNTDKETELRNKPSGMQYQAVSVMGVGVG